MKKRVNAFVSLASLTLICCQASTAFSQTPAAPVTDPAPVPLTVQPGTPLQIVLTKRVPVKKPGVPVEGRLVENVYVYDHLVIPAGSRVEGRVATVESAPRKQRALAIANGNFTPLREAHVDFNTLIEPDGKQIPLQTSVLQGAPRMIRVTAGANAQKKKGRVGTKVDQIRQQVKDQKQAAIDNVTAPGKMDRIKEQLSARLPYHRPALTVGTNFTAELKTPLTFGSETQPPQQLQGLGGPIPAGSLVHIRLVTPLSSATDHRDTPVRAVLSEPLFGANHTLLLPEGAKLTGVVTDATPARHFARNGQLRFTFRQLQVNTVTPRNVEASLQAVDAGSASHLELDAEGGAHAVTPKSTYVMPAIDVLLATTSLDLDGDRGLHGGATGNSADYGGAAVRGGASLGFAGAVASTLAHSRVVSASFAFYGAGWAVYSHFVARGVDVVFPKNTRMEIRFGTHQGTPTAHPAQHSEMQTGKPDRDG